MPPIEEWDNPFVKRERDPVAMLMRMARIRATSDPLRPVVRSEIIARDRSTCWICLKRVDEKDIEIDHVIPLSSGGKHVPDNVKVSCASCNGWKGERVVRPLGHTS